MHLIAQDLGDEGPDWLQLADLLIEFSLLERLAAERMMDEIDGRESVEAGP